MDYYKIGIAIAMSSNAAAVLGTLQTHLFGLNKAVDVTTSKLNAMKVAAAGAMGAIAGAAVLKGMWSMVEAAKELRHQQSLMRIGGVSETDILGSTATAYKTANDILGSNVANNFKALRELRGILGNIPEAEIVLPDFIKASIILSAETGRDNENSMRTLGKAIELAGGLTNPKTDKIEPEYFRHSLNAALKTIIAMNGLITETDLLGVAKQAGPMARMMDPEAFQNMMATAIMEMGGLRAGTALSAVGRMLYGGIMPQRNANEMIRLGLYDSKQVQVKRGGQVQVGPTALKGLGTLNSPEGVLGWVNKFLRPVLQKDYDKNKSQHPGQIFDQYMQAEMYKLFPTETARRIIGMMLTQQEVFKREADLRAQAHGIAAYDTLIGNATRADGDARKDRDAYGTAPRVAVPADPKTVEKAFNEAWHNMLTGLGDPMVDKAMQIMLGITKAFNSVAQWAGDPKNALVVQNIEMLTAALAGIITVMGTAAVVGAAISALGILAAPTGLLALAAGITALGNAFPSIPQWMIDGAKGAAIGGAVGSVVPIVGTAVGAAVGGAVGLVNGQINQPPTAGAIEALEIEKNKLRQSGKDAARHGVGMPGFADGYDDQGRPVAPKSSAPPPKPPAAANDKSKGEIHGDVMLDGRKVGEWMERKFASMISRPLSGSTGFDGSMHPAYQTGVG